MKKYKYVLGEPAPNWNNKEEWSAWFEAFCEYHNKGKRENTYDIVFPKIVEVIQEKEKVKPRVLIKLVREKLSNMQGHRISRVIKKMLAYGILEYEIKKSYKLILKGQYWTSHVKQGG